MDFSTVLEVKVELNDTASTIHEWMIDLYRARALMLLNSSCRTEERDLWMLGLYAKLHEYIRRVMESSPNINS